MKEIERAALIEIIYAEEIALPKYRTAGKYLFGYLKRKGYFNKHGKPTEKTYKIITDYRLDIPRITDGEGFKKWADHIVKRFSKSQ